MAGVRSLLVLAVFLLSLVMVAVPGTAVAADPNVAPYSVDSGCLDPGTTMYAWVTKNGVGTEQVYIIDEDGDGLPETVYCAGGSAVSLSSTPSTGSSCTGLQSLTTFSGCAFTIKVFMGSVYNDDNGGGGSVNCSAITDPMMFFGGADVDKFLGTDHGDYFHGGDLNDTLHGGDGPDFLCASLAGEVRNYVDGDGGPDLVWGGPDEDDAYGGTGPDLVHGAVKPDSVDGESGADFVHGGSAADDCVGGANADWVHTGESEITAETVTVDDSEEDKVFAADDEQDDITGDYPDDDTCLYDATDINVDGDDCDVEIPRDICDTEHPFVVATFLDDDPDEARLFELQRDGQIGGSGSQQGLIWITSEDDLADRVVALAIPPVDCDYLAAIVVYGGNQFLAKIDLASEPSYEGSVGGDVYHTFDFDAITSSPDPRTLVGIAFDFDSKLGGLTTDAEFVSISASGVLGLVGVVGPNDEWDGGTFEPHGYRLAFDDPDGGLFVALTEDPNPDGYDDDATLVAMTAYHPETTFGTPMEDHIFEAQGNIPFTVTNAGYGHFFTLIEGGVDGGCTNSDDFQYTKIIRRNWALQAPWNEFGTCTTGSSCCVDLGAGAVIDAITIPHYIELP